MAQSSQDAQNQVVSLLEGSQRILELSLCFYDFQNRFRLPWRYFTHTHPHCMRVKQHEHPACVGFCRKQTEANIASHPDGIVQECPFGVTEIVAPVFSGASLAGILFGGGATRDERLARKSNLRLIPDEQWLADRKWMIVALVSRIQDLLSTSPPMADRPRRERIGQFLSENLHRRIRLTDLAGALHLSPSRTGRVVQQQSGKTFSELLRDLRAEHAARLLRTTDQPIVQIAEETGFADQSHLTRVFRQRFGYTPRQYRSNNV